MGGTVRCTCTSLALCAVSLHRHVAVVTNIICGVVAWMVYVVLNGVLHRCRCRRTAGHLQRLVCMLHNTPREQPGCVWPSKKGPWVLPGLIMNHSNRRVATRGPLLKGWLSRPSQATALIRLARPTSASAARKVRRSSASPNVYTVSTVHVQLPHSKSRVQHTLGKGLFPAASGNIHE